MFSKEYKFYIAGNFSLREYKRVDAVNTHIPFLILL